MACVVQYREAALGAWREICHAVYAYSLICLVGKVQYVVDGYTSLRLRHDTLNNFFCYSESNEGFFVS